MSFYKRMLRPYLFKSDPEVIHYKVFKWLETIFKIPFARSICRKIYCLEDPRLKRTIFGIDFPNPVGLAAGFDKDGKLYNDLSEFGFGFIEVGTVTPLPQPGNEKPRMFRLPEDEAIINRMGFNNEGVKSMAGRLNQGKRKVIIGGNIGKNKNTPNEQSTSDYEICFRELFPLVDYFAVNVSSPNTPGLRELQEKEPLLQLLLHLQKVNAELASKNFNGNSSHRKPILLKIAPDLSDTQLNEIIEVVVTANLDGVIATNTTISRENLKTDSKKVSAIGNGGLSGRPLSRRSTDVIRYLAQHSNKKFVIIGVGGIHSADDAIEKLNAGADLIQLYTGFIYEGPELIRKINSAILKSL